MKKIALMCSIPLLGLITACATQPAASGSSKVKAKASAAKTSGKLVDHFADNGFGNAVAVVQHPAGIHENGITYVSYQGLKEDPYVASYNHNTKDWTGPFKAGTSIMGKDPNRKKDIDNHGKPSMIIDDEGYIHVFFGGHGGLPELHGDNPLGNHHYGENKHVVSKRPYDITEWEELKTLPPFGTYNQVIKMDNGDIYVFYRHGAHRSDWVYHVSTDNGRTFAPAVSFLKHKRRTDVEGVDSWYPWIGRGQGDELIVSFDYHLCWDGKARARGHTANREDLYYMTFNTRTKEWHNIEDERLPMPLTREVADEKAKVTDTGELWSFNGAAALDPAGNPHILINVGKDIGQITGGPKKMKHIRWDGSSWTGGNTVSPLGGRGDIDVKSMTDVSLYMTYKDKNGDALLVRRDSTNAGESFDNNKQLFRKGRGAFAISALIENAHPDARMLITSRTSGMAPKNMYLIGDNGAVPRRTSDK